MILVEVHDIVIVNSCSDIRVGKVPAICCHSQLIPRHATPGVPSLWPWSITFSIPLLGSFYSMIVEA